MADWPNENGEQIPGPEGPAGPVGPEGPQGPKGEAGGGGALTWHEFPYLEGVSEAFGGEYGTPEYAIDADFIHFGGLLKVPILSNNLLIANFPVGARPFHRRAFGASDAEAASWSHLLVLKANGEMILIGTSGGSAGLLILDDLSIRR